MSPDGTPEVTQVASQPVRMGRWKDLAEERLG